MGESTGVDEDALAAAVDRFVRETVGDDDAARVHLFTIAYNAAYWIVSATGEERRIAAHTLLKRLGPPPPEVSTRSARQASPVSRLLDDPVLAANTLLVIEARGRITGGVSTTEFPDCVAVGDATGWHCTGTLIAPKVVVTAAHCGVPTRVFSGTDVSKPEKGREVSVAETAVHPGYRENNPSDDLAILLLADAVADVPPRRVASREALAKARTVRLVGYGHTDFAGSTGYGVRRMVDVGLAAADDAYGARYDTEFVAGAPLLDRDSCAGDSGGPAYIEVDGHWQVAGATSRGVPGGRTCGDGGVYTRVPEYVSWIESVAGSLGE